MNRKNPNKRPRPSYEDGELRDPKIAEKADPAYTKKSLLKLLSRAVEQAPKSAPKNPSGS